MALRSMYRPCTPDDNQRIKAFVDQGASIVRAAAAFKRNQIAVRIRARKLGCPFPTINAARKKSALPTVHGGSISGAARASVSALTGTFNTVARSASNTSTWRGTIAAGFPH
jgi:hypothetical protein